MTVAELIYKLRELPPELEVKQNWEGEVVPVKTVEVVTMKRYAPGGSGWIDYFPEVELDEGESREQVCYID
jgi:hypothetical protein